MSRETKTDPTADESGSASGTAAAELPTGEIGEHAAAEPVAHTLTGDIRTHESFSSAHLPSEHTVLVYLPPGYEQDVDRRYPVLYLHDGQNVFDQATAFGEEWRVDETAQEMITARSIEPLIIVGIYNAGTARIEEYTPTYDDEMDAGGMADQYARMLVEELKPFIDATYRTRPGAECTGLGGSSLGGLVTLHTALRHPGVFTRLAILSPAVWWDGRVLLSEVLRLAEKPSLRIWLDIGTNEGKEALADSRLLRDALWAKGWREGVDFSYHEAEGAGHDEGAWASRMGMVLQYLFPPDGD